jgi:hypothetical protein
VGHYVIDQNLLSERLGVKAEQRMLGTARWNENGVRIIQTC